MTGLNVTLERPATVEQINNAFRSAAEGTLAPAGRSGNIVRLPAGAPGFAPKFLI